MQAHRAWGLGWEDTSCWAGTRADGSGQVLAGSVTMCSSPGIGLGEPSEELAAGLSQQCVTGAPRTGAAALPGVRAPAGKGAQVL